jgi:hypothetical protein
MSVRTNVPSKSTHSGKLRVSATAPGGTGGSFASVSVNVKAGLDPFQSGTANVCRLCDIASDNDIQPATELVLVSKILLPPSRAGLLDTLTAILLVAGGLALYATLALRLADGMYLDYYNLGFDFDPSRYVQAMALSPPDYFDVKHPLMIMLRPLAWPFLQAGLAPRQAAVLVMATLGALRVVLCWLFLRTLGNARPEALVLSVLFAVTGTQIFTSMITESYGPSTLALEVIWLLAVLRLQSPDRLRGIAALAGAVTFGLTITNTAIAFLVEAALHPRGRWLGAMLRYGTIFAILAAVPVIAVWHAEIAAALADPVTAMKEIYWKRTKGPTEGLGQMLLVFGGLSFVSPAFTHVTLPSDFPMLDFRTWSFSPAGTTAMLLWLAMLASGPLAMLWRPTSRKLALMLLTALAFNLALHTDFQFRSSLYIYAGHTHFLFFALACGLAPTMQRRGWWRGAYLGATLLLAGLAGAVNLTSAAEFAAAFDRVDVQCAAPCADPTSK